MTTLLWATIAVAAMAPEELEPLEGERVVLTNEHGQTVEGLLTEVGSTGLVIEAGDRVWSIALDEVDSAVLAGPVEDLPTPVARVSLEALRETPEYESGWNEGMLDGQQLPVQEPAVAGAACGMAGGAGCCFVSPLCAVPVAMAPAWYYQTQRYPVDTTDAYELGYYEGMAEVWQDRSTKAALSGSVIGGVVGFGLLFGGWATWMAWQNGVF